MNIERTIEDFRNKAKEDPEHAWIYEEDIKELQVVLDKKDNRAEEARKLREAWLRSRGLMR